MTPPRLALALAGTLLFARPARAGEEIAVTRTPDAGDCPSATELTAAVAARLGHAPASGLRVDFSREGEKYVAVVRSSSGERRLESDAPTCASLGDAAAIAIALAEPPPPAPAPAPAPAPEPTPKPPREPTPETPAPPPRSAIFAGAAALIGVLPRVAPAPMLAVRTRFAPRAHASAALLYAPSQSTPDGSLGFSLAAAEVGACWEALAGPAVSAGPCAHALVGDMVVSSYVSNAPSPGDKLFLAGLAGARATFRMAGPLALDLGADAVVPFGRWRAVTACGTVPYDPPRIGFFGSIGVGASFL